MEPRATRGDVNGGTQNRASIDGLVDGVKVEDLLEPATLKELDRSIGSEHRRAKKRVLITPIVVAFGLIAFFGLHWVFSDQVSIELVELLFFIAMGISAVGLAVWRRVARRTARPSAVETSARKLVAGIKEVSIVRHEEIDAEIGADPRDILAKSGLFGAGELIDFPHPISLCVEIDGRHYFAFRATSSSAASGLGAGSSGPVSKFSGVIIMVPWRQSPSNHNPDTNVDSSISLINPRQCLEKSPAPKRASRPRWFNELVVALDGVGAWSPPEYYQDQQLGLRTSIAIDGGVLTSIHALQPFLLDRLREGQFDDINEAMNAMLADLRQIARICSVLASHQQA